MARRKKSSARKTSRYVTAPASSWKQNAAWVLLGLVLFAAGAFWILHDAPRPVSPRHLPAAAAPVIAQKIVPAPVVGPELTTPATLPPPQTSAPVVPSVVPTPSMVMAPVVPLDASGFPRAAATILEAQVELARRCFSSGSIDGKAGAQTAAALRAFQESEGLRKTGVLDEATVARLIVSTAPVGERMVTAEDLKRLQPLSRTWLGKSEQSALDYETILELVSEEAHAHPELVRSLNPEVNWAAMPLGTRLLVPSVNRVSPRGKAAGLVIFLEKKILEARDGENRLIAHFPVSIARSKEKRPVGELSVKTIAPNPNYTFNPAVFPESPEAQQIGRKLIIPPGPNNPVGIAWIGLNLPGYGIHGTPDPEKVGRTESHGCFRLANWDAKTLVDLVWVDMPVVVE